MGPFISTAALAALVHSTFSLAQATTTNGACSSVQTPSYKAPVGGAGYVAQLVATGLKSPRGILFDRSGALLVVQQGSGIQHITFDDKGGTCLSVKESKTLISQFDVRGCFFFSSPLTRHDSVRLFEANHAPAAQSWNRDIRRR